MLQLTFFLLVAAPGSWRQVSVEDGMTLSERDVSGSDHPELQVVTEASSSPDALCAALLGTGEVRGDEPVPLLERRVLSDGPAGRVTYERIQPPLSSERDCTIRTLVRHEPDGSCTVQQVSANELAPPARSGVLRVSQLTSTWRFARSAAGRTTVTYTVWADPGGGAPRFLVEPARKRIALQWVAYVVKRASRGLPTGK